TALQMTSLICTLQDHRDDVNWCAFSGKLLATCSGDKTLRIYNTCDFSELPFSPLSGHGYSVHCCCFSACGQFLASCSTDATTVVWSMDSGEIEAVLEHPGRSPVRICALSPDSAHLVSGASDGTLALWDFPTKQLRKTGAVSDTTMVACSFSPCSQVFMTGSTYGDLRLWNLDMNQLHAEKNAHDLGVTCCTFDPNILSGGQVVQFRLASCGQDSLLKIWAINKLSSGAYKMQLLHTLTGQSAPVLSCAYSSDGQLLVSGSVDKTVTVYDAKNAVLLYTLNQHERTDIQALQLPSPDHLALTHPRRENLCGPIEAAGQRLVGGGCVSVAGGGRPRGIGGQIHSQQHRRDGAAQSHQGNAGVRAAHSLMGITRLVS
ncbi:hypothetical protein L3Q82_008684, partial [Scortum barcoo]